MTHAQPKSSRDKLKIALILVLGLILGGVLLRPDSKEVTANATSLSDGPVAVRKLPTRVAKSEPRQWPQANLEELLAFNPFDKPEPPPTPAPEVPVEDAQPATEPETTKEKPVAPKKIPIGQLQAVYQDQRGYVAIVNSRIVRVGDVVDGCRVIEITGQGIVVQQE